MFQDDQNSTSGDQQPFLGYSGSFLYPEESVTLPPPQIPTPIPTPIIPAKVKKAVVPKRVVYEPSEILGLAKEAEEAVKNERSGKKESKKGLKISEPINLADSPPKKPADLNEMAKGLAEINRKIADLEKEIAESKGRGNVPKYTPTPICQLEAKPKEVYVPTNCTVPNYTPSTSKQKFDRSYGFQDQVYTPALVAPMNFDLPAASTCDESELLRKKRRCLNKAKLEWKKQRREAPLSLQGRNEQQRLIESHLVASALDNVVKKEEPKKVSKKSKEVGVSAKLDLAGLKKEKRKRKKREEISAAKSEEPPSASAVKTVDLFGDDSDNNDDIDVTPPNDPHSVSEDEEPNDPAPSSKIIPEKIVKLHEASYESTSKKRTAHPSTANVPPWILQEIVRKKAPGAAKGHMPTPQQQLKMRYDQLQKAKQNMLNKAIQKSNKVAPVVKQPPPQPRPPKPGVDHREGALAATVPKGEKRTAHIIKNESKVERPVIAPEIGAKIASGLRNRYLNFFIDECLKFCDCTEDAYSVALEEERQVHERAQTKGGYLSAAVNSIRHLRQVATGGDTPKHSGGVSHESVLGGKPATQTSYSVNRKWNKNDSVHQQLSGFYANLLPYVMSEDQLKENGYPMENEANPYHVMFFKDEARKQIIPDNILTRICSRCGKQFSLTSEGNYSCNEECIYHWGRAWKKKVSGTMESRYSCCQSDLSDRGCAVAKYHVTDCIRQSQLSTYVKTRPAAPNDPLGGRRIFALDCEMVYTAWGPALARVSVVDYKLNPVYETFVRPTYPIIDCNTRFSGLTNEMLEVPVTLLDVQTHLLKLFTSETILMGHSLECDLRALRLMHGNVVDTAIAFPHRLGLPYKRGLKTLMAEYLKKIIQDDDAGHDSKEDAAACMQLMLYKVKEDLKMK